MEMPTPHALREVFESHAEHDAKGHCPANVTDALFEISRAIYALVHTLDEIKNNQNKG
jgi:hypothetical protein